VTTPTPRDDVVERAKAALENVTEGEWVQVGLGNIHRLPVGQHPPVAKTWRQSDGDFVAEARSLVPELVVEIEKLRGRLALLQMDGVLQVAALNVLPKEHRNAVIAAFERLSGEVS
jgi:hypothetical protein